MKKNYQAKFVLNDGRSSKTIADTNKRRLKKEIKEGCLLAFKLYDLSCACVCLYCDGYLIEEYNVYYNGKIEQLEDTPF